MLWDDKDGINNLVKINFPELYDTYSGMKKHIMKIDFAKAVMTYVYGGMYVDMDFYCVQNFHEDLTKGVALTLSPYYSATISGKDPKRVICLHEKTSIYVGILSEI